jgi:isocitrate/isopropylmalate dehydrogenase
MLCIAQRNRPSPVRKTQTTQREEQQKMKTYNIGVLAGDGIGPEVVAEGLKVLRTVMADEGFDCNVVEYPYSGEYYLRTKELVPERVIDEWRSLDAVYLAQ